MSRCVVWRMTREPESGVVVVCSGVLGFESRAPCAVKDDMTTFQGLRVEKCMYVSFCYDLSHSGFFACSSCRRTDVRTGAPLGVLQRVAKVGIGIGIRIGI